MFSERILFFGKADYSYMRKKNENVALTLEERNIECANEWKTFGTIRNAHFISVEEILLKDGWVRVEMKNMMCLWV